MGKSALRNKKKTFTASATKISRATNEIAIALTLQQSARPENPQRFSPSAGSTEFLKAIEDLLLAPPWKRRRSNALACSDRAFGGCGNLWCAPAHFGKRYHPHHAPDSSAYPGSCP